MNVDGIPVELRERSQWVLWKAEFRRGKWTKVPYRTADRRKAKSDDPQTWGTFEQAVSRSGEAQGIGYVFSADDPYAGVDLDGCVNPTTGELDPAAADVLTDLDSYSECSPSGVGMHAIIAASLPDGKGRETQQTPWAHEERHELAVYDRGRFFTVTGGRGVIAERQSQLDRLLEQFFAIPGSNGSGSRPIKELLAEFLELQRIAQHKGTAPKDSSRSGWDHYLACEGVRCGLSDHELAALIRHARHGDQITDNYVGRTVSKARNTVGQEVSDPALRISRRWNLGNDPIVSGELIGGVIVVLKRRSGARLRLPRVDDLFDPAKHTRIVSRMAKTRFPLLTRPQATEIAQLVIELCPGDLPDPLTEARIWVAEFIAHAGATIDFIDGQGERKSRWAVLEELLRAEERLKLNRTAAGRTAMLRDSESGELWLPASALKEHSGSRCAWDEFSAQLGEIDWRHENLDVREPTTRAERAEGLAREFIGTSTWGWWSSPCPPVSLGRTHEAQRDRRWASHACAYVRVGDTRDTDAPSLADAGTGRYRFVRERPAEACRRALNLPSLKSKHLLGRLQSTFHGDFQGLAASKGYTSLIEKRRPRDAPTSEAMTAPEDADAVRQE